MSILCIGQAVYDLTFYLEKKIEENHKYPSKETIQCMGGPAANAAYLCGLWGEQTSLIARVGQDLFGDAIKKTLASVQVDPSYLITEEAQATSISSILVNEVNGHRTIVNTAMTETEAVLDWSGLEPDVILIDGHEKELSLSALAHFPDAISIFDGGNYKEELKELVRRVDYLVCSEDFAVGYTHETIDLADKKTWDSVMAKLREVNQQNIVLTLGERGLLYIENGTIQHLPAYPAEAVDTTGAGDIFHGAFAYGLQKGLTLQETLKIAAAAASLSVEGKGSVLSIPNLADVRERQAAFENTR